MTKSEFISMHCFGCGRVSRFLRVISGKVFTTYICLDCRAKVQRRDLLPRPRNGQAVDRGFSRRTDPVYAYVGTLGRP